jgi:uncharacterized surface protein with fasciclin (FAS1) repeats
MRAQGEQEMKLNRETLLIDNATVTQADIATCDGVIHVIDTVVLPK